METTPDVTSPCLSSILPSFVAEARAERLLRDETITKYEAAVGLFIRTVGDLRVSDLSADVFRSLKRQLFERGNGSSHVNTIIYAVKKTLDYARQRLGLTCPSLTDVSMAKVPRRAVVHLSSEELEQFLTSIPVHRRSGAVNPAGLCFRALAEVLIGTGMRIGEALQLDINTINWKNQEARIIGKGGKERNVFFDERAVRWLKRYLDTRVDRNPALFVCARSGRRLSRHEAQRLCRSVARRSRLTKHVTLHVLRHTFATTLLRNGCPVGHIQGLLGHDRLETTCRYYLGLIDERELKRAHERYLDR